jgi:hypothetical protein
MMDEAAGENWVGRKAEMTRLREALWARESLLLWGPADAGKTALASKVVRELPAEQSKACIFWSGPGSVHDILQHFICQAFAAGSRRVSAKVQADGCSEIDFGRWIRKQSSRRLRGILQAALQQEKYWIFIDHVPPMTHPMARLVKELIWRCETPVYAIARGYSPHEIGYAWSLYWTDKYRLPLGPLPVADAAALARACLRESGLSRSERAGFQDEVLHLSGRLPGAIVKMCSMAAQPKYQHVGQIKAKLLRVDYLMGLQGYPLQNA